MDIILQSKKIWETRICKKSLRSAISSYLLQEPKRDSLFDFIKDRAKYVHGDIQRASAEFILFYLR